MNRSLLIILFALTFQVTMRISCSMPANGSSNPTLSSLSRLQTRSNFGMILQPRNVIADTFISPIQNLVDFIITNVYNTLTSLLKNLNITSKDTQNNAKKETFPIKRTSPAKKRSGTKKNSLKKQTTPAKKPSNTKKTSSTKKTTPTVNETPIKRSSRTKKSSPTEKPKKSAPAVDKTTPKRSQAKITKPAPEKPTPLAKSEPSYTPKSTSGAKVPFITPEKLMEITGEKGKISVDGVLLYDDDDDAFKNGKIEINVSGSDVYINGKMVAKNPQDGTVMLRKMQINDENVNNFKLTIYQGRGANHLYGSMTYGINENPQHLLD